MAGTIRAAFVACILGAALCAQERELRVVTYNVHSFGPVAAADAGRQRLARMLSRGQCMQRFALELQLFAPDVIALQEAHSEKRVKQFAAMLGMHYAYFPGGWKGKGWPEGIAGAILTRHEIVEQENRPAMDPKADPEKVFSRCFGRVVIQRGDERIAIFCAHMLPSWENTTHVREAEIEAIRVAAEKEQEAGRSVIVLGDMNHTPDAPEYRLWQQAGLLDCCLRVAKPKPKPTCPSREPKERIDYVFVGGPLAERLHAARCLDEGAFAMRAGDAAAYALSDHLPVLAVFRW